MNGYVHKKNYHICRDDNIQAIEGIIGPYFFKSEADHNVSVDEDRYKAIINDFFVSELEDVDVNDLWLQQDGPIYHTANETINLLKETFGERFISHPGPMA